jgi:hypothetical protein
MISTTIFICLLSEKQQELVKEKIKKFQVNINSQNLEENIKNAMDGRLCDLEDNIDIEELIKELIIIN